MKKTSFSSLKSINKIHMIGIGGISMSAIALVLKKLGYTVTGSDKSKGEMVEILEKSDIPVYIGSNAELVKDCDVVVYTSAINQHDPEFVRAKSLGVPCFERAKFLGLLLEDYEKTICISGTHGKTTTTSMIASILIDAGLDPNVQVGSKFKKLDNLNYRIGDSGFFVLESCEYVDSFLNFPHHSAIILNIEEDHLDYFSGIEEIKNSFRKFILMLPKHGKLIINKDDTNCMDVVNSIKSELEKNSVDIYTFSLSEPTATIYAKNISCNIKGFYSFDVTDPKNGNTYNFYLTVPGIHNVYDALASITTAYAYGVELDVAQKSLHEFCGAKRRFEFKKEISDNILVYDDYAHHPTEIKATLAAAKQKEHHNIIAVFQPHTFTRTKELLDDFSTAFFDCDLAIITDIYAAREIDDGSISSKDLVEKLKKNKVNSIYMQDFEEIVKHLKNIAKPGDIILTMGAGDITKLSDML
ncbi:MAG: UDP-N-acetylmuramate--L-alanine ligase [Clostridia bacterium]|nr:UDP-N-acetylmuramate--L-alanine ligase [Clostridia bacterium]